MALTEGERQLILDRMIAADVIATVMVDLPDLRRAVYRPGPGQIAIAGADVVIWSLNDASALVECALADVTEIKQGERSITARFGSKRYRLTFQGDENQLTEEDADALTSLALQLIGQGEWKFPNPANVWNDLGASVRNYQAGPGIATLWYDLLAEVLTVERAKTVFGPEVVYNSAVFADEYNEYSDRLQEMAAEEQMLRNVGDSVTKEELLEAGEGLDIPGAAELDRDDLLAAMIAERRATRELYMVPLLGRDLVDQFNANYFAE